MASLLYKANPEKDYECVSYEADPEKKVYECDRCEAHPEKMTSYFMEKLKTDATRKTFSVRTLDWKAISGATRKVTRV